MLKPLNTLIVEDSQSDTLLLLRELRRGGFDVSHLRVDNAADLKAALDERGWDIILSDYYMPGFDAAEALKIIKEQGLDLPVILISGTVNEDIAVSAMKAGASDFFSKDKLTRLVPAVERELREAAGRRKQHEAESRFTTAFHASPTGIVLSRLSDGTAIDVNTRFLEIFGFSRDDIIGKASSELGIWANQERRQQYLKVLHQTGSLSNAEIEIQKRNGVLGYALVSVEIIQLNDERCLLTMVHDISERKTAEQSLKRYTERLELLHEIDQAILRADLPETIAYSVLTRLQSLMEYHSASVTTFDLDKRQFTVLAMVSPNPTILTPGRPQAIETMSIIESLQQNEMYFVDDLAKSSQPSSVDKSLFAAGIRSYARVPLIAHGELLGAINFHAEEPSAFSLPVLDIAIEAAAQLAIAIHNAQLYQQIPESCTRLGTTSFGTDNGTASKRRKSACGARP